VKSVRTPASALKINASNIAKQALDPKKWVTCVGCAKVFCKQNYSKTASKHWKESTSCGRTEAIIYKNRQHQQYNLVVGRSGYFLGKKN